MAIKVLEVSDHALIRWIERVYGVDVEAIREEIHDAVAHAALAGATAIAVNGVTVCFGNHRGGDTSRRVVTTVLPVQSPGTRHESQAVANGYQKGNNHGREADTPGKLSRGRAQRRMARGLRSW